MADIFFWILTALIFWGCVSLAVRIEKLDRIFKNKSK